MGILAILVAAAGSWIFGAVWYMALSKPWMKAAEVKTGTDGKPLGGALPFIISFIVMIIVAGFMRHIFAMAGIDTVGKGLTSGLGIGLFFIAPWTLINNAYAGRPYLLSVIDGGYAVFGCAIIGIVLTLFG